MKKKFILALSLFFSMSLSMPAFAAENTTTADNTSATENYKSYAGITPGSIFYSLDEALDNLSVKLANTPSDKIEKLLEIERERLGEIQTLIDSKKIDLGVETLTALKTLSDETSTEINSILNDNNASETDVKTVNAAIKDVENFNTNSVDTLNALKNKLPKNASEKVAAVAEMQAKRKEAVKQMVTARHELNDAKKAVTTAKKALADATKSGDAAAIEKAKTDLDTANTTLSEKKTAFENAKKNKSEVIKSTKVGKGKNTNKNKDTDADENTTNTENTAPATGTETGTSDTTTNTTTENNANTTEKDTSTSTTETTTSTPAPTVAAPSTTIENTTAANAENSKKSDNDKQKKDKPNNKNNDSHGKKSNNK